MTSFIISLLDKINTETILQENKILSVNQLNAQIKLQEVWKSKNFKNYPTQWETDAKLVDPRTRSIQKDSLVVTGKSAKAQSTFYSDAASLWNDAPETIKNAKSLYSVKKEIKKFIVTLPI